MARQALVTVFLDLCCPTSSNGVGVMPLIVRRTRYPIQTLSVSTWDPLQTTRTEFPPRLELKKPRTRYGLRGIWIWASARPEQKQAPIRASVSSEVLAVNCINSPFVRAFAPALVSF